MNVYARFDEIPSMTLKVIKKTKRNGRMDGRTDGHLYRCILVCLFPYKVPLCVNFATHKGTL